MSGTSVLAALDLAALFPRANPQVAPEAIGTFVAASVVKILLFFGVYLVTVALLTLLERKLAAWFQDRRGPNRAGPGGILQPVADGIKNFMKEETNPAFADRWLFIIAPALAFIPAMMTWAVLPFAAPLPTPWGLVDMAIAPLPVGFLFTLAISSLGVYGIVLAGWSSNNKYALLGGLRSSAQMVSYEIAMGMSTIPVLLLAGNVSLGAIVQQQSNMGWNVLSLTIAWFTFLVAAFAETNRLPFDLPEAESELVAGYHTEYSGMKFSMFFIAEYANMLTVSGLTAVLFFGGWDIPFTQWDNSGPYSVVKTLATLAMMLAKVGFFIFVFMWVRWTLPRFRYDQLMSLGWSVMLPLALAYIVIIASATLALDMVGVNRGPLFSLALLALNAVLIAVLLAWLDRGKLISPASARVGPTDLERLRARGLDLSRRQLAAQRGADSSTNDAVPALAASAAPGILAEGGQH
ncbi:MAG: NADH-quinone oxidoreductase subunit NuoH [Gemmatimonas sp.]|jgi:NADH-quinone oxidoreductase subunit H|nr:NADH-quinone oxidoreductase subunit NuoH [Gemmatimonas sp.]MCA2992776.1 NADH-quinone oxidoreductase subunit NuoH [Gemmatimonas sp.]MCE2952414.1 NADH-quinone oxidoreductase subunit NuoH [Gemmatimonas sp.]MCZ8013036.1 NADH-quinone oxidoreductase subunit NuoH [Gemmatimonas sp.]MCZ8265310.1 NADH-quinone oxidoreductase subunit NuoH [Gemmatimonas sp.]